MGQTGGFAASSWLVRQVDSYHKVTERKNKCHTYQLVNQSKEDNTYICSKDSHR